MRIGAAKSSMSEVEAKTFAARHGFTLEETDRTYVFRSALIVPGLHCHPVAHVDKAREREARDT